MTAKILVGRGSCGVAAGAAGVFDTLESGAGCPVTTTGCVGMCYLEPIVEVIDERGDSKTYVKMDQ
ncbi:MAG: (2Fe-2S) ferredoxin domain-containing protein, partial [Defluviitaleaceae bacterium]|nr:(2Fe-2S) ferredoxin domain-containing protein [Defluviitaleaceae bacterium]